MPKKIDVSKVTDAYNKKNRFDPTGSYTGVPNEGGVPTQDVDDL